MGATKRLDLRVSLSYNPPMPGRPKKQRDVLKLARECFESGWYRDTRHSTDRRSKRKITLLEIKQVIEQGHHESRKDDYREEYRAWNYSIRGKTVDGRSLRVVVSFDEDTQMLLITAVDLDV